MRAYRDGHGGLVVQERRARSTGTVVQVIDNRDGSFDSNAEENPWYNLCTDHGMICSHFTRKLAVEFAASPEEWCHPEDNEAAEEQL